MVGARQLFGRRCRWILIGLLLGSVFSGGAKAQTQAKSEEVVFPSEGRELHGFLWKPEGKGPFPAMIWNHGSEKLPGSQPALASFYTSHGYVFFVPHRRGQGRSPGPYIQDLVQEAPGNRRAERMVELQEGEVADVVAALEYLRSLPTVNREQVAVSGCSYGGIQTLLVGEKDLGVMALVPFAPAAMSWELNVPIRDRLARAVVNAKAPVFLLQAENDFDLGPSHMLSREAAKKNKDFQSKIYPAFGKGSHDGHWAFCTTGSEVWGTDVLAFLEKQRIARP